MATNNGAYLDYPDYTPEAIFFRSSPRATKVVTVKSGQVLKARSFIETVTTVGADKGKAIAHSGNAAKKIAGVTLYDVDASAGDVEIAVYTEASFWADALVWSVNVGTDTITLPDGTTKAVTAYDTGATTDLTKQQFVEGSEFEPLGFTKAGEVY